MIIVIIIMVILEMIVLLKYVKIGYIYELNTQTKCLDVCSIIVENYSGVGTGIVKLFSSLLFYSHIILWHSITYNLCQIVCTSHYIKFINLIKIPVYEKVNIIRLR